MSDVVKCHTCGDLESLSPVGNCALVDVTFPGLLLPQTAYAEWVQRTQVEMDALRREQERYEAELFAETATKVRALATSPTRTELIARGYIPRDLTRPPALPREWWTAEEAAREHRAPERRDEQSAGVA